MGSIKLSLFLSAVGLLSGCVPHSSSSGPKITAATTTTTGTGTTASVDPLSAIEKACQSVGQTTPPLYYGSITTCEAVYGKGSCSIAAVVVTGAPTLVCYLKKVVTTVKTDIATNKPVYFTNLGKANTNVAHSVAPGFGASSTPTPFPPPTITQVGWVSSTSAVWTNTTQVRTNCSVNIFTPDWSASGISGFANPDQIALLSASAVNCTAGAVTFAVPAWIQTAFPTGVNFNISNSDGQYTSPVFVGFTDGYTYTAPTPSPTPPTGPTLTATGWVSASSAVWANALNILPGCTINIFTPDWSASGVSGFANASQIAKITGGTTNCSASYISFTVPAWIQTAYPGGINYNVSDTDGQYSSPIFIQFQ